MVILLAAALFESTLVSNSLFLAFLIPVFVLKKELWLFGAGFVFGVVLDVLLLRDLGTTGLFMIILLMLIGLYEKKFETTTLPFVLFASFFASTSYLLVFGQSLIFEKALLSSIIAVGSFQILRYFKL